MQRRIVSMILIMALSCMGFADDFTETMHEQYSAEDRDIYTKPKEQEKDYKDNDKKETKENKVIEPIKSDAEQAMYDSNRDVSENQETAVWGAVGMLSSCLLGGIAPTIISFWMNPMWVCMAPLFSCSAMPLVTGLTTVAISFMKVPLKQNDKYLNGNDTYKNVYRENYLKKAKLNRIKYSLYGGILVNFINLILAILSICLIMFFGYLSS